PGALPSDLIEPSQAKYCAHQVLAIFKEANIRQFGVRIHHSADYPRRLRDARHPVELLYYRGAWELSEARSVAVVGSRNPTSEGLARARRLARELVRRGFAVVSGLAKGIDRAAHL